MTALLGFMGSQAQAGPIMFSVDLGGTVIFGPTSTVNIATLNSDLAHADSIYRFVTTGGGGLSATSNFPGGATGFLQTTGNITIVAGTNTAALSVDVVQSGFLSPVGPSGTLLSTASGTYVNTTGTTTYTSDFQGTLAAPLAFTQAGSGSFSTTNPPPSMAVGAVPSGYELSNHFVISLAGSPVGASEGFSGEAIVSTVPEPASVVMLVTGMPLPLAIVFGLIRRRKTMAGA
jgi:hypothetical protein